MPHSIGHYIKRIRKLPPDELARLFKVHFDMRVGRPLLKKKDDIFPTYRHYHISEKGLRPFAIDSRKLDYSGLDKAVASELWRMYHSHRFDLLGSGWGSAGYGEEIAGTDCFLENILNRQDVRHARKAWSMVRGDYQPIDWQRDHKSGYQWSAREWYYPARLADRVGGDIKMPWELSRLQHLPRLAVFCQLFPRSRKEIIEEYENEIADFIAQNPVRRGVCFMCPMDIGIRMANIAVSYSMFSAMGHNFSKKFQVMLCDYIIASCHHIRSNLELSSVYRSNHYFADIAGLLFGAAVLPQGRKSKKWLSFARDEIDREIKGQFHSEGANREGSVAYHRLTAEMALYSVSLIHQLAEEGEIEDVSREAYDVTGRACQFMADVTRPDGIFPSIGDNDAGVFLRFSFTGELITPQEAIGKYRNLAGYRPKADDRLYYDENFCDGGTLVSAAKGLYAGIEEGFCKSYPFEASFVRALSCTEEKTDEQLSYRKAWTVKLQPAINMDAMDIKFYPSFGLAVYITGDFYLCICFTDNGQNGIAGHTHNDKLAFELINHGDIIFEDSGTYVYTADLALRDRFRSVKCHNTIQVGEEQNTFNGAFSMEDETKCKVIKIDRDVFIGEVWYRDIIHRRTIRIKGDGLQILDECSRPFWLERSDELHTRGYGKWLSSDGNLSRKS